MLQSLLWMPFSLFALTLCVQWPSCRTDARTISPSIWRSYSAPLLITTTKSSSLSPLALFHSKHTNFLLPGEKTDAYLRMHCSHAGWERQRVRRGGNRSQGWNIQLSFPPAPEWATWPAVLERLSMPERLANTEQHNPIKGFNDNISVLNYVSSLF